MNTTSESVKFNISYINMCARSLRADVRKAAKQQQLGVTMDKDFIVGINHSGNPFVKLIYETSLY